MNDSYVYIIVALLPLAAFMLTIQVNPYHALVVRGILGAVAALVYAVLGAADVALTEALVGTMLAITLYAVAVRSSMVMRLGVLKDSLLDAERDTENPHPFAQLIADFRTVASKYHLRLDLIPYTDRQSLHQALMKKEIHATCVQRSPQDAPAPHTLHPVQPTYHTTTRIRRLYDILQAELDSPATSLVYESVSDANASEHGEEALMGEKH